MYDIQKLKKSIAVLEQISKKIEEQRNKELTSFEKVMLEKDVNFVTDKDKLNMLCDYIAYHSKSLIANIELLEKIV